MNDKISEKTEQKLFRKFATCTQCRIREAAIIATFDFTKKFWSFLNFRQKNKFFLSKKVFKNDNNCIKNGLHFHAQVAPKLLDSWPFTKLPCSTVNPL